MLWHGRWIVIACAITGGCTAAHAPAPSTGASIAATVTRLDDSVLPRSYRLRLRVDPSATRFSGEVRIDVDLTRPAHAIVLHGRDLDVAEAGVITADGQRHAARYAESVGGVAELALDIALPPQRATLELRYSAAFAPGLVGAYRMRSAGRDYAATLFEAIDARRAFPCFDEPRFKTPFELVLDVPRGLLAVANTPIVETLPLENGDQRVRFAPTAPLPTYLVAFAVGPFAVNTGADVAPGPVARAPVPLRFIAPRGAERGLDYGRERTARLLQALEGYFDMPYPYAKLDIIGLPEFDAGAMENAGAITFADEYIVLPPPVTVDQARDFDITMAHELAHQWLGDLVTMPWWDDVWLNEAFASWMSYKIVATTNPEDGAALVRLRELRAALDEDALAAARAVREPIRSEHDIESAFDAITYEKGAAVLTMFERYLGADVFRDALRAHLRRYAGGTADAYALMDSLEQGSGKPVRKAFSGFIEQPGIPLLRADWHCEGGSAQLELRQSRYRPLGSRAPVQGEWQIPVCLRYATAAGSAERCTLLDAPQASLQLPSCPRWLLPNADFAGYYHWTLPPAAYATLAQVVDTLSPEEGLALADSLETGFAAATLDAATALPTLAALARARAPQSALAAMPLLTRIVERLAAGTTAESRARAFAADAYPAADGLRAFDVDYMTALANDSARNYHAAVARFLARTAHAPGLRAAALAHAQRWLAGTGDIAADGLETALEVAAQDGDDTTFAALIARLADTDEGERAALLEALAHATAPARAQAVRSLALTDGVHADERLDLLLDQASESANADATWAWLRRHFDALAPKMPSNHAGELTGVAERYCDEAQAQALEDFFRPRIQRYVGGPRRLERSAETIRVCAALVAAQRDATIAYFQSLPSPRGPTP